MLSLTGAGRGVAFAIAASAAFVLNDTLMKLGAEGLPSMQVLATRGIFAVVVLVVLIAVTGQLRNLGGFRDRWMWGRALCELVAVVLFILALVRAPIAEVSAILSLNPVLLALAAVFLFGERLNAIGWVLVGVAFLGALLVGRPGLDMSIATPLAFGTVIFAVLRDLCAKRADPGIPPLVGSLLTTLVVMAGAAILWIPQGAAMPSPSSLAYLAAAGTVVAIAHVLLISAFRAAPVTVVAPLLYSASVFAVISSVFVFGDDLDSLTFIGIGLIIVAGVILTRGRPA